VGRLALCLWGGTSVPELVGTVRVAERSGYETAFVIESFADQFGFLGACAQATERIRLATGVTTIFSRPPTWTAIGAMTVDALSGGRFVLGLGAGHREIVATREDVEPARPLVFERPLARLRETIEVVRAVIATAHAGGSVTVAGEVFHVRDYLPWMEAVRPRVPIFVGAFLPASLELAGELAEGVMPVYLALEGVPAYREAVARGAARAGRSPDEVELCCQIPCCVSDDEEEARTAIRYLLAFHTSAYTYYRRFFTAQGYGELVAAIARLIEAGDVARAADLITPEMVDAAAAWGSAERCAARIAEYRAAGITLPIVYPIHPGFRGYLPDPAAKDGVRRVIEALSGA
jgi:alkanesulfonate monooxygenase SsuD/methylene tetrahydromethanopterin reductase-like flavin-dependent oxidoreductase (luciferase family)